MAKISTYAFATPPTLGSYVIGTLNVSSKDTKNFRISDILALGGVGVFVPYTGATGAVNLGSNAITANQFIKLGGTSSQFLKADGSIDSNTYITSIVLANYVPYTGATGAVNLGGNAITANSFIKVSGLPSQFLKADGSIDSNVYLTSSGASATYVPYTGATLDVTLGVKSLTGFNLTANNSLNTNGPFKVSSNAGTAGQLLVSQGPSGAPIWQSSANAVDLYTGSFYDIVTQNATLANTAYPMILRQTDVDATLGISVVNGSLGLPTRVTVPHTGVYNIMFSAQIERTTGGSAQTVDIWVRKNELNVTSTNTKVNVQANAGFLVAAWNYFIKLNAGDYIELMWSTTSTAITLHAAPANTIHPDTPSIILTINQV